jgi:hypothetical protein
VQTNATAGERALISTVNGFCRTWYADQRAASERYPGESQQHQFAVLVEAHESAQTQSLGQVKPPPSMASVFDQFVANERRMVQARVKEASTDPTTITEGDDEYNTAAVLRHGYARQIGAGACDGVLPRAQAVAAERAAQRFDLTTDPRQGCRTLVTSQFVSLEWGHTADPLRTCLKEFHVHRLGSLPVPHNIRVQSVTGVEGLTATVTWTEIPDCGCGTFTGRLYFEHGRWLVHDISTG